MTNQFYGAIQVDKAIKPQPRARRIQPDLKVGRDYFVSFLNNIAYPCILREIINEFGHTEVRIELQYKTSSKKRFIGANGKINYRPTQTNIVRAEEIGLTPEDAVRNQV